jgi:hypothetical protein
MMVEQLCDVASIWVSDILNSLFSVSDQRFNSVQHLWWFLCTQGEKECAYYMRTGSCKYNVTCKFHHPQPTAYVSPVYTTSGVSTSPAAQPYPQGLPSWPMARAPYLQPRLQAPSSYSPVIIPSHQGLMSMPGWNPYQVSIHAPS